MQNRLPELLEDYKNKVYTKDLQIKYNLSYTKLIKILKENKVYKKNNSLSYPDEIPEFIKNNYMTMSNKDIAKELNINEDWLRVTAKNLGLLLKGSGWKYSPEIDNIDFNAKEFSYFLGWLATDGNISKDFRNIKLAITDKEIIDRFIKYFKTGSIYLQTSKRKKTLYSYCIFSNELGKKLNLLGITPNKSRTLSIKKELWNSHFLRGVFEGDGHVRNTLSSKGTKRYEAGFSSESKSFTEQLECYLKENNVKCVVVKEKNVYRVRISGKDNLRIFYKLLYTDCGNWYLKRKKQILDLLFSNE